MAERPRLLVLATEIVSARVSRNAVAVDQLPGLIQQVFGALATAEQAATAPAKAEPAVAVRRSIFADHIVCLDCGKHLSMLKRHLMTDHKLTAEQYPTALGDTILISAGRSELCESETSPGEEVRAGPQGSGGTHEGRTKNCPEGATTEMSSGIAGTVPAASRRFGSRSSDRLCHPL